MNRMTLCGFAVLMAGAACAAPAVVDVSKAGSPRVSVAVKVGGNAAYKNCLERNLKISGYFELATSGAVTVTGTAGGTVTAAGGGKSVSSSATFATDAEARLAARKFADEMVKKFSEGGTGFASARVVFVNRKGSNNAELYTCYPDGMDIRQITSDGLAAVGPRWAPNGQDVYYTGFLHDKQLVYRVNLATGERKLLSQFKGGATGAAIAPDGRRAAIILSYQGNPELYVLDLGTGVAQRMTTTPAAAEASPAWSPDGTKIAYTSDQSRSPQIYVCDVASRKSTRYTSVGKQNTHPDWSKDGQLCWTSLRNGQWVVMAGPVARGEKGARAVTAPGDWQDPSWTPDARHLVASRDKALFIVDVDPEAESPVAPHMIFGNKGNWMNPAVSK